MIKENEILVGNTFFFPFHNQNVSILGYAKIEKDDSFKVQFETNGGIPLEPISVLRPIPLAEEILLKCKGVGKCTTDGWLSLNICNDWTFIYFNIKQNVVELSVNHHSVILDIKYLHQLQNLILV